ncbi:MAG: hypothetical protein IJX30_04325 [Clostridia bacterium]|nr:hypothetical protein [Clostridia bacterium]
MDKIKRVFVSLAMAFAVLFGGVFSLFGVNNVKAKALGGNYFGQDNAIYYFSDYYPTLSNIELSSSFGVNGLYYDVQKVDENEFASMVNANYFSGFGDYCTFILDIKTFAVDTTVLDTLFDYLKNEEGCYTGLMLSSLAASGITDWSFADNVDIFATVDFSELEIFAEDIVTRQCGTNEAYDFGPTGNNTLHNTTFLFDNILDNPVECAGMGLEYLQEISPFFDYFITDLLENVEPDASLEYSTPEEMLTLLGIRLLAHTTGNSYVDLLGGETVPVGTDISDLNPTAAQDYAVVGFSNLCDPDVYEMIEDFQDASGVSAWQAEYKLPVHILEAETINFGSDGIAASIYTGGENDASAFLDALQALLRNSN